MEFGFQSAGGGVSAGLIYMGTWDAFTNTPTLTSGVGTSGQYYIVSVDGTTNLDGITDWMVGDWVIFSGTAWQKIDNSDIVGIQDLNGLTFNTQTFATGTSGSDFNISSVSTTHTFNLPDASATNRGALTSTDWTTFNSKQNALTFGNLTESTSNVLTITGGTGAVIGTGTTIQVQQASGSQNGFLSSSDWTTFNSKVGGSGTTNYISKFTGSGTLGNSVIYESSSNIGVGTVSPSSKLQIVGIDSTSSNYALKVDNSSSSPLLYVRNDGFVTINGATYTGNAETFGVLGHSAFSNNAQNFTDLLFYNNGILCGKLRYYTDRLESSADRQVFMKQNGIIMLDVNAYGNKETRVNYYLGVQGGNSDFNPTATIHAKGIDATSSNYALKVDNSASSPLLYVRNDGATLVGSSMVFYQNKIGINDFSLSANFSIINGNDTNNPIKITSSNTTLTRNILTNNGAVSTDIQIGNLNGSFYFGLDASAIGYLDNYTGQSFLFKNNSVSHSVITSNNNWGIGTITPTAKLNVKGVDATSSNYALKIDNSTPTTLFSVRNDGVIDTYGTITPRIQSVVSAATVTPTNLNDEVVITAQAAALLLANPTGTAVQGQSMLIRIKDNGTARAISYDTQYRAIGVTLPTTTTINKTLYLGLVYNSTDTKWDVIGVAQEA